VTEKLAGKILGRDFSGGLENELARTLSEVRTIFEKVFNDVV